MPKSNIGPLDDPTNLGFPPFDMHNFTSIPFKTESHSGFTSVNGVAKFSSAGIVLEFESKLFGLISDGVKEVRVPVGELLDVKFKKGMLKRGARIEIRLRSFAKLTELPHKDGKATLKIAVDDFDRAQDAVAKLQKDMAEYTAALPPPHPPIASLFDESECETQELDGELK